MSDRRNFRGVCFRNRDVYEVSDWRWLKAESEFRSRCAMLLSSVLTAACTSIRSRESGRPFCERYHQRATVAWQNHAVVFADGNGVADVTSGFKCGLNLPAGDNQCPTGMLKSSRDKHCISTKLHEIKELCRNDELKKHWSENSPIHDECQ